ncbi:MAG: hypothetical protein ACRD0G_01750 [Acidimicrobiales bacterium]
MPRCRTHLPHRPPTGFSADEVPRLAALLDDEVSAANPDGSAILRASAAGADELEVGVLALPPSLHPIEVLLSWTAPSHWLAIGVAALGQAHRIEVDEPPVRVRALHVVTRSGAWVARWHPVATVRSGECLAAGEEHGDGPDPDGFAGRIDDACRLALGLPTAPPPVSTVELLATVWLDAIVATGSTPARPIEWPGIAALHPAAAIAGRPTPLSTPERLVELASDTLGIAGWTGLRRSAGAGCWHPPGVSESVACWLDDGAFARWVMGAMPDLADLRDASAALVPADTTAQIDAALAAWGLG